MQANNPAGQPGQVNLNNLVKAMHIQQLPNLSTQQKAALVQAVGQCMTAIQANQQGTPEYNKALGQWQQITQKYLQARNAAQRGASAQGGGSGAGPAGQQGGQQQQQQAGNVQMAGVQQQQGQNMQQQQMQGQQAGQQQQAAQQKSNQQQQASSNGPPIPPAIMDYVNKYTYYHSQGAMPGTPEFEAFHKTVKEKHARILFDHERSKGDLKKIKTKIAELQASNQEVPQNLLTYQQNAEKQLQALQMQLQNWGNGQKKAKELFLAKSGMSAANQNGSSGNTPVNVPAPQQAAGTNSSAPGTQASPVATQQPGNASNAPRPGTAMSPTAPSQRPQNANQGQASFQQSQPGQANTQMPQQQTPQSMQQPPQQQRGSISGQQQPPISNIQTPQSAQQSSVPTPLTQAQALQRAYSGPQTAQVSSTSAGGQSQPQGQAAPQPGAAPTQPQPQPQQSQPPHQQPQPTYPTPREPSKQNPGALLMSSKPISPSLSQPPVPVQNYPASRPTMAGPANGMGGVMGQPAIVKPTYTLTDNEGGGVLSKRKLDELVRQVTGGPGEGMVTGEGGGAGLTGEVEEALLLLADEFVDNVITAACKLAKLRDSSTLDVRDIQLILERNYNIRVPGYASDELRAIRKFAPAPGWTAKMNAVQAAKVMGGAGLNGGRGD